MRQKKILQTNSAPKAIGPYSQAVEAGGFLFLSGQIALNASGAIIEGGIESQTKQVLENIKAVLQSGGAGLEHVVKTTIYLKNLSDFQKVNDVYSSYFSQSPPARATVEVSRLPRDVLIEIEAVAYIG